MLSVYSALAFALVALLAEGVDRNESLLIGMVVPDASPSSQRAWIEILMMVDESRNAVVALLAEGVDRNHLYVLRKSFFAKSPSSQRAWIEM